MWLKSHARFFGGVSTYPNLIGTGFRVTKQLRTFQGKGPLDILNFKIGYNHETIFKLPMTSNFQCRAQEPYGSSLEKLDLQVDDPLIKIGDPCGVPASSLQSDASRRRSSTPARAFCLQPTLICLYGIEKNQVTQMAAKIRQISPPSTYTTKGLFIVKSP